MRGNEKHHSGEGPGSDGQSGAAESPGNLDTGLVCLVMLLKYLDRAADPEQIRHEAETGGRLFNIAWFMPAIVKYPWLLDERGTGCVFPHPAIGGLLRLCSFGL